MNRKEVWNDGWQFAKTAPDVEWEDREVWEKGLERVDLPHDWLIYDTERLYESSIGWYRKEFILEEAWEEPLTEDEVNKILNGEDRAAIRFGGVYMDSALYVNGKKAGEWKYGYSAFEWDITEYLQPGKNEIVVRVAHIAPNSRWYSGAGIYRNVNLLLRPRVHIPSDGIYVSAWEAEDGYRLLADTELSGMEETERQSEGFYCLEYALYGQGMCIFKERKALSAAKGASEEFFVKQPMLWDMSSPNLYQLELGLIAGDELIQRETVQVGFRKIEFLPDKGFLLNGRKVRLNGACDHHDLGALGAAFSKAAMKRKLEIMHSMGVNAIRTSHNMPAEELMELADEMGFLILSEGFDMWEISKNPYDYGRFFKEWAARDVRSWVRRDRNHPSLLMWSIGNEIPDTHADAHGQEITRRLSEFVREWDYRGNAPITIGSNYMPWENAQKCADIVKHAGYNYAEKYYEEHHGQHPDWVIYGSETASVLQSRGIYHFPLNRATLLEEDEQCSALGNSTTSWGAKNAEYCITMDRDTEYSCGQFIWTAFDYIGEPTPYQTKNSYFGQIDTAGFPKDSFYLYQAEWTDYHKNPMVHIYPYWDFNPGQPVDVRVCSNAPYVELFVNGVSYGKQKINHAEGAMLQPSFKVSYQPGNIRGVAYDEEGNVLAEEIRYSFLDTARLVLKADRQTLSADGEDMLFVEISAVDKDGHPVENAADYVRVEVSGAARLVGLDNGDSTDYDQYKGTVRKLFSGKLLAMLAAKKEAGEIRVKVEGASEKSGIAEAELVLQAVETATQRGIAAETENTFMPLAHVEPSFIPVRKIELTAERTCLTKKERETVVRAKILPAQATDTELLFELKDVSGMESRIASMELLPDKKSIRLTALGDGELVVRCLSKNGTDKPKLISVIDVKIEGLGTFCVNPYELVAGAAYSDSYGDVGRGHSNSAGTDRGAETRLTYADLDFGEFGSDEITLSVFANDSDAHRIQIWEGIPGEPGSEPVGDVIYQKPGIWQVFQPQTYRLQRRLHGVVSLTLVTWDKMLLEGFWFTGQRKAFAKLNAAEAGNIYGDSYTLTESSIEHIGNNVSLRYENMNFGEEGTGEITVCGRTPLAHNTIQLRISGESEAIEVLEFPYSEEYVCHTFPITELKGNCEVTFVFLPGCSFDFAWFKFHQRV